MIKVLSTRYRKLSAFLMLYSFFVSGLCSSLYAAPARVSWYSNTGTVHYRASKSGKTSPVSKLANDGEKKKLQPLSAGNQGQASKKTFIGGPGQPEMSAFKPVGADNMVDLFTGDFSYNIPLLDVGGYPVNIFYNSGITMDQEPSWCGLGWNINPGTISRNMRGLPDDYDGKRGDQITKTQYTKPEKTFGVNVGGSFELFGGAFKLGLDGGIFYNNMRGVGLEAGINPSLGIGSTAGDPKTSPLTLGWNLKANSQSGGSSSFSISLADKEKNGLGGSMTASLGYHSRMGLQSLHVSAEVSKTKTAEQIANSYKNTISDGDFSASVLGSSISFAYPAVTPSIRTKQVSSNYSLDLGFGPATWGAFSHLRLGGYYSQTKLKETETKQPAYGMLYMQKGNTDKDALLDFNRLNDGVYTPNSPTIAIPAYTYDIFSISGEGTGGSFRAYRGDLGNVSDAYIENASESGHLGIELGGGTYGHGAINANFVYTPSSSGAWKVGNLAKPVMDFRGNNGAYQAVYFKNPGEKAIPDTVYQNAIGGEDMVRLKMTNVGIGNPTLVPTLMKYTDTRIMKQGQDMKLTEASTSKGRDKRTQVISFLTADEANKVGLDKKITSFKTPYDTVNITFGCNTADRVDQLNRTDETHKAHQLSEIDVLMQDGRKYVYGIPVMNTRQVDVTFNKTGNSTSQMSTYTPGTDNVPGNNPNGKEGYVEKQELPPYAHSFLLTGLLSPNYVDVKGDGITEDDMGDAIKFNYSKMANPFKWRTPAGTNSATFSEGLKTDNNDDKSHYIYGEREMWYLYTIESKNMVARFYVKNDRRDSKSVTGEEGTLDNNWGAQRLYKIALFTKADLLKNGAAARPIKTVHFTYDYSLCANVPNNDGLAIDRNGGLLSGGDVTNPQKNINIKKGKLTLRSIYFTYNGNEKAKKNYYKFNYPTDAVKNPDYDFTAVDRWGNYKPASANPASLLNPDYPYTKQDKTTTDAYSQAWVLNNITLPSGGSINVEYESDDYAYVQNRRAAAMYEISGFGKTPAPDAPTSVNNTLYQNKDDDNDYIYINVTKPVTGTTTAAQKKQIEDWYLGNLNKSRQLFMKIYVQLETDKTGSEPVPVYAEIDDYGLVPNSNGQKIYIKVKKIESGYTPMVQYSLQFMKNFLPKVAYPGYDVSDEGGLRAVVKALGGLYHSFKEVFNGGFSLFKQEGKCRYVNTSKSFVRLTEPNFKKLGGGLRVKKVVINDNWDKMTKSAPAANDGMGNATYGQEYSYTKKELVNGEVQTISSGVASWEPSIGGEENPHREMMSYFNKNKKGPFDYSSVELPLAEMFFPSPSVGYSRVEVKSIHRDTVKNAAGIQVTDFYTTREFPTTSNYTPLEEYNATDRYEPNPILKILKIDVDRAVALSQGFKVDLNDMNGRMRKQASYSPLNLVDPISYTENFYNTVLKGDEKYQFNHYFPVMAKTDGVITPAAVIGREVELMTDFREHKLQTITTNVNFNLDIISGLFIPIPIPTAFTPALKESDTYRSAAVLKVVNHYAVLDSVVAVDKGSMVSTKNLVYDAETGDVLVSRTNNEHNKPLYSFSYPSHWAYSGMGPAYKNIDVTYSGVTFRYGKLETGGVDLSLFESGDELYVIATNDLGPGGIQPCDAGTGALPKSNATKIWAVNTAKVGSLTPQILFIDAEGNPYTAKDVTFRIIRSGKRNMLGSSLGSVTSLNTPIQTVGGIKKIVFDNSTAVLQTAAATYKDHWRVDNVFYKKDSLVTVNAQARIKRTDFYPSATYAMNANYRNGWAQTFSGYASNLSSVLNRGRGFKFETLYSDNWLNFNLAVNPVPAGAEIVKASLSLSAHLPSQSGVSMPGHYNSGDGSMFHPSTWSHRNVGGYQNFQNSISIIRLTAPWPAETDHTAWEGIFTDYGRTKHEWLLGGMILPTGPYASNNYILTPSSDTRIDFTASGKNMVRDFQTAGNTNASAIRLFVTHSTNGPGTGIPNKLDLFQCFWAKDPRSGNNQLTPKMSVYYYVCGDMTTQTPQESFDPLINQVINCNTLTATYSFCRSKFSKKSINPYVEGIWGNWRVDTTYAYYSDRKEQDVAATTDLRTAGTINNIKTFWNFNTAALQRNTSASDVWVWTSTITQYNRKGYDIENRDPLGRYNAGLYGYNQQLPIAVVNNSRYREAMFDGFEDYDYNSNGCNEFCKTRRHANFDNIGLSVDAQYKHSGKSSLRVNAGTTVTLNAPVVPEYAVEAGYRLRVRVDSTAFTTTTVVPRGTGFKGKFYNSWGSSCGAVASNANTMFGAAPQAVRSGEQINYDMSNFGLPGGITYNRFAVKWEGYIQPTISGNHSFMISADDGYRMTIEINGVTQTIANRWDCNWGVNTTTNPVSLTAGQTYKVTVDYFDNTGDQFIQLVWKTPANPSSWEAIPKAQVYSPDNLADANGTVTTTTIWCTKLDSVQVRDASLTDTFSLVQGKKMYISAWVREGGNDCKCSTYTKSAINISFTGSSTTYQFKPSGSIIEGWQRYEGEFPIPANATGITVGLANSGTQSAWFDDVRIHPYNANMRSFVYHPQNLRLMAEMDENNYGSFYEYDDDGTLIRVKKETARGVKTITETRSALQKSVEE